MAEKPLAQSVFRTYVVQDSLNHSCLYAKEADRAIKANLIKVITKPQTMFEFLASY